MRRFIKKQCIIMATLCMALGIVGCGGSNNETEIQVTTKNAVQEEISLSQEEKAAVLAMQYIRDGLKNPHSLKVYSIKREPDFSAGNAFLIEFSATNDYGAEKEYTLGIRVDNVYFTGSSDDISKANLIGSGIWEGSDSESEYTESMDADKIMNHIDDQIYSK